MSVLAYLLYASDFLTQAFKKLHERKLKGMIYVDKEKRVAGEENIYSGVISFD